MGVSVVWFRFEWLVFGATRLSGCGDSGALLLPLFNQVGRIWWLSVAEVGREFQLSPPRTRSTVPPAINVDALCA